MPTPESLKSLGLTNREAEVLFWVAQGKTNRDIADILKVSSRTVAKHLEHIYFKLGVESRTNAAMRALELFSTLPVAPKPASSSTSVNPLSLYFSLEEFTSNEIAQIISLLSEVYREEGGDSLVIDDVTLLESALVEV